jgi:nucleoid-associated protein YejK
MKPLTEIRKEILDRWSLVTTPDNTLTKTKVNDIIKCAIRDTSKEQAQEFEKMILEVFKSYENPSYDCYKDASILDYTVNKIKQELLKEVQGDKK